MTASVMLQGAGSNVGKSLLAAGLCRHFARQGITVRPFKPQNMSNNAAVTQNGGEIGRAQALQARACFAAPHTDMNPVLLKPQTETGAQIIVNGAVFGTMKAREYGSRKADLLPAVTAAYDRLSAGCDLVIIEGAGSPAEINLRQGDIANMGFAEARDIPVIMIGDIDRGGVIASLVGTGVVLDVADQARIKGFVVNKFRGDTSLFHDGMKMIADATGWQALGILPWFEAARYLPAEDILDLSGKADTKAHAGAVKVAVPVLKRIANFDDLDPLVSDPNIAVTLLEQGEPVPADTDLVLLCGSKSTIADMAYLHRMGWAADIAAHVRRGGHVMGLCGGYQMLGKTISDPHGIEGPAGSIEGLGLLDISTILEGDKTVRLCTGHDVAGKLPLQGYEIHMGVTTGADCARPLVCIDKDAGRAVGDGAVSANGLVVGTYMHGLFANDAWRQAYFASFGKQLDSHVFDDVIEQGLNDLADHLAVHMDMTEFSRIAGL